MYKTNDKIYIILLSVITLFMRIGYASINSVTINIMGDSSVKKVMVYSFENILFML